MLARHSNAGTRYFVSRTLQRGPCCMEDVERELVPFVPGPIRDWRMGLFIHSPVPFNYYNFISSGLLPGESGRDVASEEWLRSLFLSRRLSDLLKRGIFLECLLGQSVKELLLLLGEVSIAVRHNKFSRFYKAMRFSPWFDENS